LKDRLPAGEEEKPRKSTPGGDGGWGITHFFSFAVLAAYFYTLMEWLFFITKPSFLDLLPWSARVQVLFVSAIPGALVVVLLSVTGLASTRLLTQFGANGSHHKTAIAGGVAILTMTVMLMIDNFTWTLFRYGIATARDYQSLLYLVSACLLFMALMFRISRVAHAGSYRRILTWTTVICLSVSVGFVLGALNKGAAFTRQTGSVYERDLPNILFFAADGIDAKNLAVYGYDRYTTPFADTLLSESLIVSSAFTNASRTTGAIMSMLTGRYPATTKVLFPPHALIGEHSFRHLPAILRGLGYRQIQESVRYYADSHDMNMRQAFDESNGRDINDPFNFFPSPIVLGLGSELHFIEKLWDRVKARVLHLTSIKKMDRVYEAVTQSAMVYGTPDKDRIDRVIQFATESNRPFFAHIHLMESHCCRPFKPRYRHFSNDHSKQSKENRTDYYDDVILDSDRELGRLVAALKDLGKWENTVLVYSSDHNIEWEVRHRIPLIMRFPGGRHRGTFGENASLLDVAPTILDYLAISKPDFMEGESLLSSANNPMDPIFSIGKLQRTHFHREGERLSRLVGEGPPLYGLTSLVMTICHRWYSLDINDSRVREGLVRHHPNPCKGPFPDDMAARRMMENHLKDRNFLLVNRSGQR